MEEKSKLVLMMESFFYSRRSNKPRIGSFAPLRAIVLWIGGVFLGSSPKGSGATKSRGLMATDGCINS